MNDLIMRDIDRMTGKTHVQCDDVKREAQIHIHTASDVNSNRPRREA